MKGQCLCGGVVFELTGDVQSFYLCHCNYCKKGSGSAHAANIFVAKPALTWLSGESLLRHYQVPDSRHERCFCSVCGAPMPMRLADADLLMLPVGCLDEQPQQAPDAHLYMARVAPWERLAGEVAGFDGEPDAY